MSAPSAPGGGVPGAASVFSPSATFVVSEDASSSRAEDDVASPSSVAASEASSSPGRRSSRLRTSALGFGAMGFLRPKRAVMGLGGTWHGGRQRMGARGVGVDRQRRC